MQETLAGDKALRRAGWSVVRCAAGVAAGIGFFWLGDNDADYNGWLVAVGWVCLVWAVAELRGTALGTRVPSKARMFGILAFILALGYGGHVAAWFFPSSEWALRWMYFPDRDLENADYTILPRPHDCEFLTAPLGAKHCDYERSVQTIRVRTRDGNRQASSDDGKTWTPADATTRAIVLVAWQKVQQ